MNFEALKTKKLAIWIIGVPFLLAVLYYSFFAMDRYVSSAQISVRQTAQAGASELPGLAIMLGGVNPTSREETLYLRQFILSHDMLQVLQSKLNWADHYAGHWRDPIYWLRTGTYQEYQLDFYQRVVTATFDEETGLLTVQVEAFEPKFAQEVLAIILDQSERFVNEISHRMARDQMAFAEAERDKARQHYEDKREVLLRFQAANNLLDPISTATARSQIVTDLEASLIKDSIQLKALLSSLGESSPQIAQLRTRIRATEQQLQVEKGRLVSLPAGDKLNVIAAQFRNLEIDAKIAEEAYKMSIVAMENARIEATKKLRSLVKVTSPNLPDLALFPRRIYNLITIAIVLLLLYGIARFVIATIEDHRD
jgi:capsular polysaccharide transport system permease protein